MKLSFLPLLSLLVLTLASPVPVTQDLAKRETALNAFLALLLDFLPAVDGTINALAGVLTAFEQLLAALTGEQITYNQLSASSCKAYTVIFARGTTEPGNVGILVGPPFFTALRSAVGSSNVVVQGVNNYAASVAGYLEGGDPNGSANLALQVEAAYKDCPNTKLVVGGYSQGGQIVHNGIALVPAATASWISKVVIFGDPDDGQAIPNVAASKVKTYCSSEDNICVNGDLILPAHLLYGEDATSAAAFVAS